MKIWVIGRNYPLVSNKMQGSFELEQAKMLSKYGNSVTYFACVLHPSKYIKKRGFQCWKEDNLYVCTYSAFFIPRLFPFYFVKIRNAFYEKLFRQAVEQFGMPDVIHVHYPAMLMLAPVLKAYSENDVRIVATEHWTKVQSEKLNFIEKREIVRSLKVLDACICVGMPLQTAMEKLNQQPKEGFFRIPNIVGAQFNPTNVSHIKFQFVAAGRLVALKQFDKLIEAFTRKFRGKNAILVIIGYGVEYKNLKKQIASLCMESQIILKGALDRAETAECMAHSDCLCCPSRLETFGVPVIEGWACGLPVIASDNIPAIMEYANEKLAVPVPHDDTKALENAMEQVFLNYEKYDKQYIADFVKKRFSEEAVYQKLMELYHK
ncbi:MAG: glycosyltransferase family 4 protein [Ruminococcus sp.]|nr:glycosyltransferase family 4 protein [Ruminococcus sp.]